MAAIKSISSFYTRYVLVTLVAVILTWFIHEFAHWAMGVLLGNKMIMTLNTCYPVNNIYLADWHKNIISSAGTIVTIVEALIAYWLLKRNSSTMLFPFLLTCFYMRSVAGGISVINPNDEARISASLGLGLFTLPILVASFLFYFVYRAVREKKISAKQILATILLIMIFSSMIILADQAWHVRIL